MGCHLPYLATFTTYLVFQALVNCISLGGVRVQALINCIRLGGVGVQALVNCISLDGVGVQAGRCWGPGFDKLHQVG